MRKIKMKIFFVILLSSIFLTFTSAQESLTLKEGMKAPNFKLQDHKNKTYSLAAFQRKSVVVLYFYPKAGTAGCTKQACDLRDDINLFKDKNIVVLGISVDSKKEIKEFVKKNNLNFPLLSDKNKTTARKYGVLREDGLAKRVTFIIDKEGIIRKIITVSDISSHAKEVLNIASEL